MIDNKTLNLITEKGIQSMASGHTLDGIAALRTLTPYCAGDDILRAKADNLEDSYSRMLAFLRQGGEDKMRNHVCSAIRRQGIALLQQTHRAIRLTRKDDLYSQTYTNLHDRYGHDMQKALTQKWASLNSPEETVDIEDDIFCCIWTSPLWTAHDTALWFDFIMQQQDTMQQHLCGALLLASWEYFDNEKMQLLCQFADSATPRTSLQASTYLLLLRLRHHSLGNIVPSLPKSLMQTNGKQLIAHVQHEMLLMLLSEKDLEQEFNETQELGKEILNGEQGLDAERLKEVLETKTRYLKRRIEKGMDINLNKASLLHNCQFMQNISHWFLPFDKSLPLFQSALTDEKGRMKENLSMMMDLIEDCDIDKLATLYLISTDKEFSDMAKQLDRHKLPVEKADLILPEYSLRHLIQDLYRIFTHSPLSTQLNNPFREGPALMDIPELARLMPEKQCLGICATLLELTQFEKAVSLIDTLAERKGATAPMLLAKGQALLSMNRYAEAAGCLRSAEVLDPDNALIQRMLIQCYAATKRFEEEEECIRRYLNLKPDDASCRKLLPLTLLKAGKTEEALQCLFRLNYEKPDDADIIQCIATAAMQLGKLDLADRYTEKGLQLEEGKKWLCYFRGGHIRLLRGDWKGAMDYYLQYTDVFCKETGQAAGVALSQFDSERNTLLSQGLSEQDFILTREMLQAAIEAKNC